MTKFHELTSNQWVGFATRRPPLHWVRGAGFVCIFLGVFDIGTFFWNLLDPTHRDFDLALMVVLGGLGVLGVGLLMVYVVDGFLQRQEIKRGTLTAIGAFWNPTTNEKLKGRFEFDIDSGSPIAFLRTGFRHSCKAIRHDATQASATKVQQMSKPNLKLLFNFSNQLIKGQFASCVFNQRSYLDTIVFAKGLIIRAKGLKADPCAFCTEIGKLLKDQAPNMIDVQLAVQRVRNLPRSSSSQSSNAGVIGAHFGAVGAVVGTYIEEKKNERPRQEQAEQQAVPKAEARELSRRLEKVAAEFGWTTNIKRGKVK